MDYRMSVDEMIFGAINMSYREDDWGINLLLPPAAVWGGEN